jgi:hypothetical protein
VLLYSEEPGVVIAVTLFCATLPMASDTPKPSKTASSDPALQKGKAWVDTAAMVVLLVILALIWYFL